MVTSKAPAKDGNREPSYSYKLIPPSNPSSLPVSQFVLPCNFSELAVAYPSFGRARKALSTTPNSDSCHHSFHVELTRALLHHHWNLQLPSLPAGHLVPPVPNRSNYVLWLKHLLSNNITNNNNSNNNNNNNNNSNTTSTRLHFRAVDIGTGVSAIYPLLLTKLQNSSAEEHWRILATDIDPLAVQSASTNVHSNHLERHIRVVTVQNATPLRGPLWAAMEAARQQTDFWDTPTTPLHVDVLLTNPPFYSTVAEATAPRAGDKRSRAPLSLSEGVYHDGGEVGFVKAIMRDSLLFRQQVTWYTSLLAKRSSLDQLLEELQSLDGVWGNRGQIRTVEFRQTDKTDSDTRTRSVRVRWGIGWTFQRALGKCPECRIREGVQSFVVAFDCEGGTNKSESGACQEVVARLLSYFQSFSLVSLKCTHTAVPILGLCVSVREKRFFERDSTSTEMLTEKEDNDNLPLEGHFMMDVFVNSDEQGCIRAMTNDTTKLLQIEESGESNKAKVVVTLEMYSHTRRGTRIIDKIRNGMPGEIGRTNRKWRRIQQKKQTRTWKQCY